ncbi:MAG: hypothetical protein RL571_1761 [Pseudomonadota bacterium]|jgi:hypothetical protein
MLGICSPVDHHAWIRLDLFVMMAIWPKLFSLQK